MTFPWFPGFPWPTAMLQHVLRYPIFWVHLNVYHLQTFWIIWYTNKNDEIVDDFRNISEYTYVFLPPLFARFLCLILTIFPLIFYRRPRIKCLYFWTLDRNNSTFFILSVVMGCDSCLTGLLLHQTETFFNSLILRFLSQEQKKFHLRYWKITIFCRILNVWIQEVGYQ